MKQNRNKLTISSIIVRMIVMLNVIIISTAYTAGQHWYLALLFTLPVLLLAIWNTRPTFKAMLYKKVMHKHQRVASHNVSEGFLLKRIHIKSMSSNHN